MTIFDVINTIIYDALDYIIGAVDGNESDFILEFDCITPLSPDEIYTLIKEII